MSAHQLSLPFPSRRPPKLKRAHRDLTATEFARAIARNGFREIAGGTRFVDVTGICGGPVDGIFIADPIRLARRRTLAALMRARQAAEVAA